MNIEVLHVGMKVRHPQYGLGVVKSIGEHTAEIRFEEGMRTVEPEASELQPTEAQVAVTGLGMPLKVLVADAARAVVEALGVELPGAVVEQIGARWHKGRLVLHPSDPSLQAKEVPLEVFFHKIVGLRNQLRVLEQKINSHPTLTDGEKIEWQQYISRCYGSLTTFNVLFRNKEDQFSSKAE